MYFVANIQLIMSTDKINQREGHDIYFLGEGCSKNKNSWRVVRKKKPIFNLDINLHNNREWLDNHGKII